MKKVYLIIVVHNQKEETLVCLKSLKGCYLKNYQLKMIIVDNASKDETVNEIKRQFPSIKIILNQKNLGFAKAVNQGLKIALADGQMAFVLLLNNDTVVNKYFLNELIKTAEESQEIGLVAPALRHHQGEKLLYGMEGHLDLRIGKAWHRNLFKIRSQKLIEADFVSGCCLLIKRDVLKKVGLFDERFYLYLEDVDYCLRAKKKGFKIVLNPKIIINHKVSASSKNPLVKLFFSFRSNLIFIWKWTSPFLKPLAFVYCFYFYLFLAIIWSLSILKRKLKLLLFSMVTF